MATATHKLTYRQYLESPEIKQRYEIVDGVMELMSPAPNVPHQRTVFRFAMALQQFVKAGDLGEVIISPWDIIISRKPLRTRQPDLFFVSHARQEILKNQVEGPPDVVVEILSPGNTPKKVQAKLEDYARLGIPECWILAATAKTLEVLELAEGTYRSAGVCSPGSPVNSKVLRGFTFPTSLFD